MKLLFDQNLSHRLCKALDDVFPGSSHVSAVGMATAEDEQIWRYARDHGYALVTLDSVFDRHESNIQKGTTPCDACPLC